MNVLHIAAKQGRFLLVLGLVGGATLPGLAQSLRPWLPELVALLLFLTATRVGPKAVLGSLKDLRRVVWVVLALQVAAPLTALVLFAALQVLDHPFAFAVVLMLSAPSVTGAPNFLIMMGRDPAHAMRILVVGTAIFPLTVVPVLLALPSLDGPNAALAPLRLIGVILLATCVGFFVRTRVFPNISEPGRHTLDGLSALALAVVVVGLMSEIAPMLRKDPMGLAVWCAAVLLLNFGLQVATHLALQNREIPEGAAISLVSGNRNIALFLIALPVDVTGPLLIFIGCYQIPMYLTPLVMKHLYQKAS